jgi:hypothetical protein
VVPVTVLTTTSIWVASFSICAKSMPNTLIPIGVRIPLDRSVRLPHDALPLPKK